VRLWNVATQQQIAQPIPGGNSGVNAVAFRPDGRTLATADAGGMRIWDVSPIVHPFAFVCDQVGSLITPGEWRQYVPPGQAYSNVCE
jgi:WD40 repeat protein